jgi:hypothetical protein
MTTFGFSDEDIRTVIQTCTRQKFREGEVLFGSGSPSTEMLLILSGVLLVRANTGAPLAQLFCPETVGEMGLLTGEPRSATVDDMRKQGFSETQIHTNGLVGRAKCSRRQGVYTRSILRRRSPQRLLTCLVGHLCVYFKLEGIGKNNKGGERKRVKSKLRKLENQPKKSFPTNLQLPQPMCLNDGVCSKCAEHQTPRLPQEIRACQAYPRQKLLSLSNRDRSL